MWRKRSVQAAISGFKAAFFQSSRGASVAESSNAPSLLLQQTRSQWGRPDRVVVVKTGRDGYYRFGGGRGGGGGGGRNMHLTQSQIKLLMFAGAGGTVVWVSSRQDVPYTGRVHAILVTPKSERDLGRQAFNELMVDAKMRGILMPASHPTAQMVHRVGSRIAAVAADGTGGGFQDHMKGLHWEFVVINSPEVNAFVLPGGKVVVYTGLLNMIRREDELAAVLAHEVAHVVARHVAERITRGGAVELARIIAYWGFGVPIPSGAVAAVFFLPNSRQAETEADMIGVQLAARACYDPAAAVEVFEKFEAEERRHGTGSIPNILRTHPVNSKRIATIKQMLPRAALLREAAGCEVADSFLKEMGWE